MDSNAGIFLITVTDARAKFLRMCKEAEAGRRVVVTKYGVPYMEVVALLPPETYPPAEERKDEEVY